MRGARAGDMMQQLALAQSGKTPNSTGSDLSGSFVGMSASGSENGRLMRLLRQSRMGIPQKPPILLSRRAQTVLDPFAVSHLSSTFALSHAIPAPLIGACDLRGMG